MFAQELLNQFKDKISNAKKIAIFGHENVDGDAVGSMLGLGKVCEKMGKEVGYFTTMTPGRSYQFLAETSKIQTTFDYSDAWDLIIFVDFNSYDRIGKITEGHEDYFNAKDKILVDHHLGEDLPVNTLILREVEASSCCELLYEICKEVFNDKLDADIATYWYMGLVTDTGNFQYEKDTIRTMNNAIGLITLGAKKEWIIQNIFSNTEWDSIDLFKMIIPRVQREGRVCYAWYKIDEIEKLGFDKDEADVLILSILRPLKNMGVIAILRAGTEKVGISLRSGYLGGTTRINVQQIASFIGGGGHMYAAGCKVPTEANWDEQRVKIVNLLNKEIEKQLS